MILFSTKLYRTNVEHLISIFSENFCFRNIHSSSTLLFTSLAQLYSSIISTFVRLHLCILMAPEPKTTTKFISSNNANTLKAVIFHTMAFKLSLEINMDQITIPTKRFLLKVLYNVCKIKEKHINFEQYARLHLDGPKLSSVKHTLIWFLC